MSQRRDPRGARPRFICSDHRHSQVSVPGRCHQPLPYAAVSVFNVRRIGAVPGRGTWPGSRQTAGGRLRGADTVLPVASRARRTRLAVLSAAAESVLAALGLAAAQAWPGRPAAQQSAPAPSTQGTGRPCDPPQRPAGVHCRAPWAATGPGSSASASPSRPIAARQSRRSARACCERRSGIRPQAWYPAAGRLQAGNSRPAAGPFPLIVFAPGFRQGGTPYSRLLQAWASAGFVVAGRPANGLHLDPFRRGERGDRVTHDGRAHSRRRQHPTGPHRARGLPRRPRAAGAGGSREPATGSTP